MCGGSPVLPAPSANHRDLPQDTRCLYFKGNKIFSVEKYSINSFIKPSILSVHIKLYKLFNILRLRIRFMFSFCVMSDKPGTMLDVYLLDQPNGGATRQEGSRGSAGNPPEDR